MDKKFILKAILLNSAWVLWIVLSVFLGYIIYREGFPSQRFVIIPFSLLFLAVGGVGAFLVNRVLKKRRADSSKSLPKGQGAEKERESNITENIQADDITASETDINIAFKDNTGEN